MLARCVATLKPPPELTLSQWADRYRMLSAESSAEPGRWHTDKAPYQREIMDAIGDAHIRRVVIMCAAQLGKTELLLNILGYFMAYAPAPILVMQPTLDMGQTFSKDRLAPMIRDTPVLRGLVDVKSRYAGNTILKKNFPGGHITIVGANSATGLASRPIKVLLADEVDRYPGSAGTEGDPLSLAQKRQTTFWDKKTVMVSTPVIKGHSRIETEYNQSTREEWNVPCPECGHYQPFVWANLIFDPDDLQKEIIYKCERCGCVANEYRWKQQSQQGRFVAENPGAETRGFHLNTLASTFCGWKEIVQKFIVAKEQLDQGNPEGMKVWVNTELGETWEERGEQVEDTELFNRREIYDAVVPEEVLVLTAGVDVQDDRFEVEIVGWGVGKESWGIRYQKIYGDMQIIGSAIQAAMPIIQGIITVIMTIGSVVVPALLAGFEAFSAGISAVMSAIQGIFQGLITFITGVFSGSWSQAWEGIKQIFGSAFDGLVALCKAPLNAVIAIINKAISGINGLGLTIPEWVPILGGKSFSINIPALPMLARGGFTDGVSIAGEAGTEAVISFQRGVRSDNINTWTQAGRMLGVSGEQAAVAAGVPYADGGGAVELATLEATQGNNAVELQEIDTGKPQPEQDGGGTPDGGGQVVFAPQITVQGNADRAVLESVLDDAQQRFELWYEQMMRRKARTAY